MPNNNSWESAAPIALSATVQYQWDSVSAASPDFYRFTLPGRSSLNLKLTDLSGNADLTLFDSYGTVLQQSLNQGTLAEEVSSPLLNAGTYYVRVLSAAGETVNYTLTSQAQNNPYTDIIWRNYNYQANGTSGQNVIWQVNSRGEVVDTASLPPLGDLNWEIQATGDFNGDGQQDLVWRNVANGATAIWALNQMSLIDASQSLGTVDPSWRIAGTGDFNRDGKTDLVWRNQNSGQNVVWFLNGSTYLDTGYLPGLGDLRWKLQGVGDFNRDGTPDLVWRNYASGQNVIWFLNGTTYAGEVGLPTISDTNWQIQGVGDFDGDHQPDLFWRYTATTNGDRNWIWGMDGATYVRNITVPQLPDSNWRATAPVSGFSTPTPIDGAGNSPTAAFNIGSLRGWGQYNDLVGDGDEDYYSFSLAARARVDLYLWGGVSLTLSGNGLTPLTQAAANGLTSSYRLNPGTYFVRLSRAAAAEGYWLGLYADLTPETPTGLFLDSASDSGVSQSDQVTNVRTPTIRGRAETGTTVSLFQGATWLGQATTTAAGNWAVTTTTLADGYYSLTARATNASGDASAMSGAVNLTIDTTAPIAPVLNRANQQPFNTPNLYTGRYPVIGGQAEPSALLALFVNGRRSGSAVVAATDGTWTITPEAIAEGTHTLSATATDFAGNVSLLSAPQSLRIDTTAPTLSLTALANQTILTNRSRFTGRATDSGSGLAFVKYQFVQGATQGALINVPIDATGSFDRPFDFTSVPNGQYRLRVVAGDQVGLESGREFDVTVTVDRTPPILMVALAHDTAPGQRTNTDQYTFDPTIGLTVTDTSRIAVLKMAFEPQSTTWVDVTSRLQAGKLTLSRAQLETLYGRVLPEGQQTLRLQSEDEYGNQSTQSLTFTFDTTKPTLTLTGIANQSTLQEGDRLVGSLTDASSFVALTYRFDTLAAIPVTLSATGTFNQFIKFAGVSNGLHQLIITGVDRAGNTTENTLQVTVNRPTLTAPLLTATLLNDTGRSPVDYITADAAIAGRVDRTQVAAIYVGIVDTPRG